MSIAPTVLAGGRIVVLLGVAALLVFTLWRYRHNVLQGPAFALMVGSAVTLAGSLLAEYVGLPAVGVEGLQLVAAGLYLGATWEFAREFVDFGPEPDEGPAPPDLDLSAEGGGFQDDGD